MIKKIALRGCSSIAFGGALMPLAAFAQAAPSAQVAKATTSEEIIVTAQKREQNLIDVAQSVSVISGSTLETQQANNFSDYLKLVPGLQLVQATPGQGRLVLRGINTGGTASTVAVYVDETPFGSTSGLANGAVLAGDFDTFDVARIEVLRGPQGTLYGASSLGGLIKFVTNAPSSEKLEVRGRASVEDTDGSGVSYKGTAVVNIPLGDTLAVRASGSYRKEAGFIDSIGTAGSDIENDINDSRTYGGRASLLWKPTADLDIRLSALLQNIEVDAPTIVESNPASFETLYGRPTLSQYVPSFSNVKYRVYNGLLDYDFGFATLTSSTSYSTQQQSRRDDLSANLSGLILGALGTPNDLYLSQRTGNRKWTEELRLASAKSDRFDWLIGGYYTDEKAQIFQEFTAVQPGTLTPIVFPFELAKVTLDSKYQEYAGFGNATLHLGERFDIDFGGRYSHNSQRAAQTAVGVLAGNVPINNQLRSSDNVFTYSVAPKFKFGERASLYGRVAKGYRPGGPNAVAPNAPAGTPLTFQPDTVVSYEVGFKGETADRTFGLDLAVYHIDWTNIQLVAVINNFGVNVNGSGAKSDGAEITATLRPTEGLVTSINAAYTRARLTGDTDPLTLGGLKGDRLPFSPKYVVGVNADYSWSVGGDAAAFVGGSIRAQSQANADFDPAYRAQFGRIGKVPAYEVVDLRGGVNFGRFGIEAYVKNLTNSEGRTSVSQLTANGLFSRPNGAIGTGVIRPRTIGLTLSASL